MSVARSGNSSPGPYSPRYQQMGIDDLSWLTESEHDLIRPAANARIENGSCVIIVGIAKRVTLQFEHKTRSFNFILHADRIDSMQCFGIA